MGPVALIIGILAVLGAFATNTAPEGTHNIGLLQHQMMLFQGGLALLIISAIRWERRGDTTRASEPVAGELDAPAIEQAKRDRLLTIGACIVLVVLIAFWFVQPT